MARKKYDEKRMPFLQHLEELRWHIFRSVISIFVLMIVFFMFSDTLLDFFTRPYPNQLQALGAADPFMIRVKISFFVALIASIPVIVREIWAFIAPGLLEHERKYVPFIIFLTSFCFIVGAAFAFFIALPLAVKFFLSYQTPKMVANVTIDKWLGLVTQTLLGFGIVFELPVLAMFLSKIGLVTPRLMRKYRSHAVVAIFVVAAVITPSTDAYSQLILAGPLLVLYEISVLLSGMIVRKKKEQEEQEEREYEEELRKEAELRKKAARKAAENKDGEELKMWETEGDFYETNKKTSPVPPGSSPVSGDAYPYDMNPMYDEYYGDPYGASGKKGTEDKGTAGDKPSAPGDMNDAAGAGDKKPDEPPPPAANSEDKPSGTGDRQKAEDPEQDKGKDGKPDGGKAQD